jgi:NAD(P)-dependent dehydrogenase (short-subunit alcohol dehydrogenase family)/acyl dehydratase
MGAGMLLTADDVALFRRASCDLNPLHSSTEFARRTPFHEPIAHGVLACLAAVDASGVVVDGISHVEMNFRQPVFPGIAYELHLSKRAHRIVASDNGRAAFDVTLRPGAASTVTPPPAERVRSSPADLDLDGIESGMTAFGSYGPRADAMRDVASRWPTAARRLGPLHLASLMWCSFIAGMEIPGRRGLLCRVSVRLHPAGHEGPLTYRAEVEDVDRRFGMVTILAVLSEGDHVVAEAEIEAMVLSPAPLPSLEAIREVLAPSTALANRTAVVVGGSRGLGAAVSLALLDQGCHVLVGQREAGCELERLGDQAARTSGELTCRTGDAADPAWAEGVRNVLASLDLLVCNAAPAVRRLDFVPTALPRFDEYITKATRLVSTPLSALLPVLSSAKGRCLTILSSALDVLPADWPHYVTAKAAVEGLVKWTAANHPDVEFFTARPGALLTDQMNTPGARDLAAAVEPTAAVLVRRLIDPAAPEGGVESVNTP